MANLISYTLGIALELLVSEYFRYTVGMLVIFGVLGLIYKLTGKAS